jgi:cob(I)alamin adenosyltransferase
MTTKATPIEKKDLVVTLEDSANQLAFINLALIAIHEREHAQIMSEELCGIQNILFSLESKLRGAEKCASDLLRRNESDQ